MKKSTKHTAERGEKNTIPRRRLDPSLTKARSAITNGSMLLPDIDGRSAWARRLRDLVNDAVSDLGGRDMVSSAEMILIRRASMLTLQSELMEQHWADNGGEASPRQIDTYQRLTGSLRRVLESLGLQRRARDVTPNPLVYAKRYDRRHAEAEEVA
jgi:hypothetical protein